MLPHGKLAQKEIVFKHSSLKICLVRTQFGKRAIGRLKAQAVNCSTDSPASVVELPQLHRRERNTCPRGQ